MSRRSRQAARQPHQDAYKGLAERAKAQAPEIDPKPRSPIDPSSPLILPAANVQLQRPQNFSATALKGISTVEQQIQEIAQKHDLEPKLVPYTEHRILHLSRLRAKEIRKQLGLEGVVDPGVMREPLFHILRERLGKIASDPMIAFVESIQVVHRERASHAVINASLGSVVKKEVSLVHAAVNEVCGAEILNPDPKPWISLGVVHGFIEPEVLAALRPIQNMSLGPLQFGPITLPDGYPPLHSPEVATS